MTLDLHKYYLPRIGLHRVSDQNGKYVWTKQQYVRAKQHHVRTKQQHVRTKQQHVRTKQQYVRTFWTAIIIILDWQILPSIDYK